jgi:hypothetical protein
MIGKHKSKLPEAAPSLEAAFPPAPAAPSTVAQVEAMLHSWQDRYSDDTRQILELEKSGTIAKAPRGWIPLDAKADGLALLHGKPLEPLPAFASLEAKLVLLHADRNVLREAIALAQTLHRRLAIDESVELFEREIKPDYDACMRQIAELIISMERVLQRRDRLLAKLPPECRGYPGSHWKFLGRLTEIGMNASHAYMFLEMAVKQRWITEKEFRAEVDAAAKTDRETIR